MAIHGEGNTPLGPYSEGEKTNPADNDVMADTGAIVGRGGNFEVLVTIGASAAADFALQRRNAANGASVGTDIVIKGPAGQSGQYRFWYVLDVGERMRVIMDDALTGTAAVSINMMQQV